MAIRAIVSRTRSIPHRLVVSLLLRRPMLLALHAILPFLAPIPVGA